MLKRTFFSMVLLGMSVAPLFAQQTDNVEKALRFRAKAPKREVVVQSDGATRIAQEKETLRIQASLKGSSAQLPGLGSRYAVGRTNSDSQLEDLGGYIWNSSGSQLKDLGCPWCSRGHQFSAGQLEDLGPSGRTWVFTAGQLEDMGGYAWNHSGSQLKDLGPTVRPRIFNAGQLKDLGGFIWNNSDSQLKDLGGFIWSNSDSQLKDLGCPYCSRGHQFSAGQLEDLGQSRYAVAYNNSGSQLESLGPWIIFW